MKKQTIKQFLVTEILSILSQFKPSENGMKYNQMSNKLYKLRTKFDDDDIFILITERKQREELIEIISLTDVGLIVNIEDFLLYDKLSKILAKIIIGNIINAFYNFAEDADGIEWNEILINEDCLVKTKKYFSDPNFTFKDVSR